MLEELKQLALRDASDFTGNRQEVQRFVYFISATRKKPIMALIVDKHRPKSLDTLTYHPELSDRLRSLVGFYHNIPLEIKHP